MNHESRIMNLAWEVIGRKAAGMIHTTYFMLPRLKGAA